MNAEALTDSLSELFPELLETYSCPGIALAVLSGEDTYIRCGGLADLKNKRPVVPDTVFQACSISKAVAAWGILRLVDDGVIDLDTPVDDYLSRWHLPPSDFDNRAVTVRRLLSHTAGLPVEGYTGVSPEFPLPSSVDILEGRSAPMDDRQQAYARKWGFDPATKHEAIRVKWSPGEKWSYSGGGYVVLDLLIEEMTGSPAADYLDEAVLAPLGLTASTFRIRADQDPDHATGYDEQCEPLPRYRFPHCTAGGMTTTIEDLARFVRCEFDRSGVDEPGRGVLSPAAFAEMFKPWIFAESAGGIDFHMGLGHFIANTDAGTLVQHSGGSTGWRSIYFALPASGQGFAVLINGSGGNEVWQQLSRRWFAALSEAQSEV